MMPFSPEELEARLIAAFDRRTCPSADELRDYLFDLVEPARGDEITFHLAECPRCDLELAQLHSYLLDDLAPEGRPSAAQGALGRVHVAVARLVSGARDLLLPPQPAFVPVYAGLRGGGGEPAEYEAGDVRVYANAQPDAETPDGRVLRGLIIGLDQAGWTAYLWQGGTLVASSPVDEGGNFSASGLTPGGHEVVLSRPGRVVYIEELLV
jgi:hypothetical protein